jgi:hypothetical protein
VVTEREEVRLDYLDPQLQAAVKAKEERQAARFFLHPKVPLWWVTKLLTLNKCAIKVGLAIVYLRILTGKEEVKLTRSVCEEFGISRTQKSRGLVEMRIANLIHQSPQPCTSSVRLTP